MVVWQWLMWLMLYQLSWLEPAAEPELQHSQDAVVAVLWPGSTSAKIGSALILNWLQAVAMAILAKGCVQHPGFYFTETFSPVVQMVTLQAILAFILMKGLKIQQMDVKGAYLNGTLEETIYM
jgi:Reverse transcriptase (RNA-dependent DNA polymerase)